MITDYWIIDCGQSVIFTQLVHAHGLTIAKINGDKSYDVTDIFGAGMTIFLEQVISVGRSTPELRKAAWEHLKMREEEKAEAMGHPEWDRDS